MTAVVCNFQKKTIYHCSINENTLVDFILGSCAVYEICQERGWDMAIDFSTHRMAKLFLCKMPVRNLHEIPIVKSREELISLVGDSDDLQINLNAQFPPEQKISETLKEFLFENFLTQTSEFQEYVNQRLEALGLENKKYFVVYSQIANAAVLEKIPRNEPTVLICENKEIAAEFGMIPWIKQEQEDICWQAMQFYLYSNAAKIIAIDMPPQILLLVFEVFNNVDLNNFAEFSYGVAQQRINCTENAKHLVLRNNQILIKRKDIFNDFFGDVAQNREKTLRISFQDRVSIELPERRSRGYAITQSDT